MVEFNFLEKITLDDRTQLKRFLGQIAGAEGYQLAALSIVFCSDDYLLEVNRTYLNHDFYTDIITFDYSNEKGIIDGELFISVDRVRENAKTFKAVLKTELLRVIFHGVLHLCGYRDKTKRQVVEIRAKEDLYLGKYLKRST